MQLTLGIDVSKKSFDAALLKEGKRIASSKLANKLSGFLALNALVQEHAKGAVIVLAMEATGRYGDALANFAFHSGWKVHVINPARIKAFTVAVGQRNKTDRADAMTIALFAERTPDLLAWAPLSASRAELRDLVRERLHVQQVLAAEELRLQHPTAARKLIEERVDLLKQQVKALSLAIGKVITADAELKRAAHLLQSIPGVGAWTAAILLSELPPIDRNTKAREIASLFGACPRLSESGTSLRRAAVGRCGRRIVMHQLYLPAMVAWKHNPKIGAWADALKERGKAGKQIIVAIIHRLLRLAVGVLKSQTEYRLDWSIA